MSIKKILVLIFVIILLLCGVTSLFYGYYDFCMTNEELWQYPTITY